MSIIDKDKVIKSKKYKFTLKNIKKFFSKLLIKVNKVFVNFVNYVKNLPRYILLIAVVWVVIVLVLLGLIIFCNANNKKLASYEAVVDHMNVAALDYVITEEIYPATNKPIKVSLEELVASNYYNESKVAIPSTCSGYSVVFYNEDKETDNLYDKYFVESYINCKDFTSKDYNDYVN